MSNLSVHVEASSRNGAGEVDKGAPISQELGMSCDQVSGDAIPLELGLHTISQTHIPSFTIPFERHQVEINLRVEPEGGFIPFEREALQCDM